MMSHPLAGVIYELLEHGGRVGETKEHDCGFEEVFVGDKGCFPLMTVFDANVVAVPLDVKFDEKFDVFEVVVMTQHT